MRTLIFLLAIINSVAIHSQSGYMLSATVTNEGISLDEHGALLLDDSCTFCVVSATGQKVKPDVHKWSFEIEKEKGSYIKEQSSHSPSYRIKIDSLLYEDEWLCWDFKRYVVKNDSSIYYLGRVIFEGEYQGEIIRLNKEFFINLLPAIPKVKVLDIIWSHYDEEWKIYDDGYMTLQLNSYNVNNFEITEQCIGGGSGGIARFMKANSERNQGIGVIDFYDGYGYLTFGTANDNGYAKNEEDTLWISKVATSISDITIDNIPFYPNPVRNILSIQDGREDIFPLSIYDIRGRLVKYIGRPTRTIDVSNLTAGIYFVSYKDKNANKKATFKMIKEK